MSNDQEPHHIDEHLALTLAALSWSDERKKSLTDGEPSLLNLQGDTDQHQLPLISHNVPGADFQEMQDAAASVVLDHHHKYHGNDNGGHARTSSTVSSASTTSPMSSDSEMASYDIEPQSGSSVTSTGYYPESTNKRHPRLLTSNCPVEAPDNPATQSHRQIHWAHPLPETVSPKDKINDATSKASSLKSCHTKAIMAGDFEPEKHFYPRVLNAGIHPLVGSFFSLGNERILHRYAHLNPNVDIVTLRRALAYQPQYFMWGGADLFNVTTANGKRQMIVVETNSCPSGQKSMPLLHEGDELGGYGTVMRTAFRHLLSRVMDKLPDSTTAATTDSDSTPSKYLNKEVEGDLAVVFDKNPMEASGYAAAMADVYNERVWLVEYLETDPDPPVRWTDDAVMEIRDENNEWHAIRACFRYVTQRPWTRIPIRTRTQILNSALVCLAGGRNKQIAALAYEFLNAELNGTGLQVRTPITKRNVTLEEIPLLVKSFGGHAVIKVPYSNAGQGVYTITNQNELDMFMSLKHKYQKFIVQSLVGNASWSSQTRSGRFYHVGTVPNRKNHTFANDLRVMVAGDEAGFRPIAIYGRRARKPLLRHLDDDPNATSWEMLGTNLSLKLPDGSWTTESSRLMLMDRKDFNQLGVGLDDLIDAYVQTILSVTAIDMMCQRLIRPKDNSFDFDLFRALNPDQVLLDEIKH